MARIDKFIHKDRRVTYGLLHWPRYILWHCVAYRNWYFAVPFGMSLTGSSCLNREQQSGKNAVRTHFSCNVLQWKKKTVCTESSVCTESRLVLKHRNVVSLTPLCDQPKNGKPPVKTGKFKVATSAIKVLATVFCETSEVFLHYVLRLNADVYYATLKLLWKAIRGKRFCFLSNVVIADWS
jgi:hypothetical protein